MLKSKDISPTFCILPWIHLSTRPNGHLRLCCTACASSAGPTNVGGRLGYIKNENSKPANLNISDLVSSWNNEYMKSVRRAMLNSEIPASCMKCFKEEKAGFQSKRMWETDYWSKAINLETLIRHTKKDGSVPPKLYYVDLRFGTKCNLKCIMCSPHDSSMWISDWQKLYPQIKNKNLKELMSWKNRGRIDGASYDWYKNNRIFWKQLYEQIPHIKQLYFAGGEALIIDEHYSLLEECIKRGYAQDIELRYNSNGIDMPGKLFELWGYFRRVRFCFSLDSIEEINYYIRYPSNWNIILSNLKRLDKTGNNIEVTLACAVQVLNIYYIPELIKWKIKMNFKKINSWPLGAGLVNYHFVYHPAHLNVKVFPKWFKDNVAGKFEKFYAWLLNNYRNDDAFISHPYGINRLKSMVSFMYSDDWSNRMPEFREYIRLMDKIRGTSFRKVFPEMGDLL